ncbi:hypothetical protein ACJX0J_040730 [Zea mays]
MQDISDQYRITYEDFLHENYSFDCLFLCNLLLVFVSCRSMYFLYYTNIFTGGMQLMHQFYNFSCLCNYIPFWIDNHVGKNGFVTCVPPDLSTHGPWEVDEVLATLIWCVLVTILLSISLPVFGLDCYDQMIQGTNLKKFIIVLIESILIDRYLINALAIWQARVLHEEAPETTNSHAHEGADEVVEIIYYIFPFFRYYISSDLNTALCCMIENRYTTSQNLLTPRKQKKITEYYNHGDSHFSLILRRNHMKILIFGGNFPFQICFKIIPVSFLFLYDAH